jgi:hypothetical protein
MKLSKFKITNKGLYWGLIICFALLYLFVGFVSTLHSITFFNLANTMGLAVLLGITYEVGQASVLFSILMSEKNKNKFLPWALMFLLTALQVTANVFASFKYMATSGSNDWMYWQKSILIGVQAANPEMYQVIISWIAGALLPVVALGMTALVAQNMKFMTEESEGPKPDEPENKVKEFLDHKFITPVADLEKPSDYVDFDETGIGGRDLTPEEEQQLSDYLDEEMELISDVQSNVVPEPGPEIATKKAGRPPKQKDVVVPKKAQELLPNENVEVPQKENTLVNPLEIPSEPIKPVKTLEEAFKPSKGDEVIALIEKEERAKVKEPIIQLTKDEEMSQESLLVPPELLTPYLDGGVEVIDAKAIPKPEKKTLSPN